MVDSGSQTCVEPAVQRDQGQGAGCGVLEPHSTSASCGGARGRGEAPSRSSVRWAITRWPERRPPACSMDQNRSGYVRRRVLVDSEQNEPCLLKPIHDHVDGVRSCRPVASRADADADGSPDIEPLFPWAAANIAPRRPLASRCADPRSNAGKTHLGGREVGLSGGGLRA